MNFSRCRVLGFGRLADLTLSFHRGLNLIFAPNEGGKSTLQQFLLGQLYGPLREEVTHQRRPDLWVDHFKPWQGAEYGGILWCELAAGGEIEIHRSFRREEPRVEVRAPSGEDITGRYERRRNGEVLFAKHHLGVAKDLYESVAVIRESQVGGLNGTESIRDRIANLAQTGDEQTSVRRSLEILEAALEQIGTERAPTKPYKKKQDRIRELSEEQEKLADRRAEFQQWVERRNELAARLVEAERELRRVRGRLSAARYRETERRVQRLEKVQEEIEQLRQRIAPLAEYESFPGELADEWTRLVAERSGLESRLVETRSSLGAAAGELQAVRTELEPLSAYAALETEEASERLTEGIVRLNNLQARAKEAEGDLARAAAGCLALESEWNGLSSIFKEDDTDWARRAREAADAGNESNRRLIEIGEELVRRSREQSDLGDRARRGRIWGGAAVVVSLSVTGLTLGFPPESPAVAAIGIGTGLALLVVAAALFRKASRAVAAGLGVAAAIGSLEEEQGLKKQQAEKVSCEISLAVHRSGCGSAEEFLRAADRAAQLRTELAERNARRSEIEQRSERVSGEREEIYGQLKARVERAGLACTPDTLDAQAEVMRQNLRRYRALENDHRSALERVKTLEKEERGAADALKRVEARIRAIHSQGGAESAAAFEEALRRYRCVKDLREQEAALVREYRWRGDHRTLQEWRERLDSLSRELEGSEILEGDDSTPEELEQLEREARDRLGALQSDHSAHVERVNQAFRSYRTASEIEEDLALEQEGLERLVQERDAIRLASEIIGNLSRSRQEELAPKLNRAVERRFLAICSGRYQEVRIDPDFGIWVRESGTGELRGVASLSRGTQDQLYFALRFGLLDVLTLPMEPCPCLLDEPFAAYDRERLEKAFDLLQEEARSRQLLLFTCREDVAAPARARGAHYIEILSVD